MLVSSTETMQEEIIKKKQMISKYKSKSVTKDNVEDLVVGEDEIS